MSNNLNIYNEVRKVPNQAKKKIQGGRLSGMTDINPMWRIKKLTELFGLCGFGWKYEIVDKRLEQGANDEIAAFVDINLYIKQDGEWSEPIQGTGGSTFVADERKGLHTSDECFKMALTDAISIACKALGFGADVYWEKDTSKYTKRKQKGNKNKKNKNKKKYRKNKSDSSSPGNKNSKQDNFKMPFGKHEDKPLKEIPDGYLQWVADEMDPRNETGEKAQAIIQEYLKGKEDEISNREEEIKKMVDGDKNIRVEAKNYMRAKEVESVDELSQENYEELKALINQIKDRETNPSGEEIAEEALENIDDDFDPDEFNTPF